MDVKEAILYVGLEYNKWNRRWANFIKNRERRTDISKNYIYILKGVIISIIFTLVFLFVFSILLTYTNINEKFTNPTIIVITAISILIGSSIGNIKVKKNGLLNGALIGGIYLMIIYIISSIINNNFLITKESIIMIIAGMIFGMIGGIIGVNKK